MIFNEQFYRNLLDSVDVGIYFVDKYRQIVYWNNGAERITGYSARDVLSHSCADNILVHVDDEGNSLCSGMCPLACTVSDGAEHRAEVYLHHKNGHRVPVSITVSPIRDEQGAVIGAVETFRDNSTELARKEVLKEWEKAASLDALTGLPNRRLLETKLMASFEELKRHGLPFGIIFADIDQFKYINDTYGHVSGDEVLRMVARTLSGNVRAYDLVGRWGGEEFLLVICHIQGDTIVNMANKLRALVGNSFLEHDGHKVSVTITMGVTMAHPEESIESLVKRADGFMYAGKMSGRNCVTHDIPEYVKGS